ncbi:MAG: hypothetical protein ABIY37_02735 [Devosia sp.]
MPNPTLRPLPDKPAGDDEYRRADGTWDVERMNTEWAAAQEEGSRRRAAATSAKRKKRVADPVRPENYPWMKPGWKW